jgi:hypothetical protein
MGPCATDYPSEDCGWIIIGSFRRCGCKRAFWLVSLLGSYAKQVVIILALACVITITYFMPSARRH